MQDVFEQISLRGLLFFFKFQTQKTIQKCTHECHCSKLKFKSQSNPSVIYVRSQTIVISEQEDKQTICSNMQKFSTNGITD